ncbi:MAG: RagB/SusD family nutrient uptake outer membrane protein [Cyclobacteriaceae bacterium]
MKNIIYVIVFVQLFLYSCSDDFIDLAPLSQTNVKNFYSSSDDIEIAVNGAYSALQLGGSYKVSLAEVPEIRSDNSWLSWMQGDADSENIIEFQIQVNNPIIAGMWTDAYKGILRCNVVLDRIDQVELESNLKNRYVGEVKFLRALTYFNLVRLFGDVPMVLKELKSVEESYEYGRKPVAEVYEQIHKDLKEAEEFLPLSYSNENIGRATKGAAKALRGKVYLTQKNYAEAKVKLKEVIDLGVYDLLPDYASLWDLSNENSIESIFEVQFKKGGNGIGSSYANRFPPKFSGPYTVKVGTTDGHNCPTQDMEDEYEPGDLRKDISMATGYTNGAGEWVPDKWVLKFMDVPFVARDSDNNWPVIRYADVLLMYAEVLNELGYVADGEAFDLLNEIRSRAGLGAKTSNNPDVNLRIASQEEFRMAIEHERRVELAFENHRFFDLVRTGRFVDVMSKFYPVQDYQILFPIPQTQIDINPDKIWQNPGYIR